MHDKHTQDPAELMFDGCCLPLYEANANYVPRTPQEEGDSRLKYRNDRARLVSLLCVADIAWLHSQKHPMKGVPTFAVKIHPSDLAEDDRALICEGLTRIFCRQGVNLPAIDFSSDGCVIVMSR